MLREFLGWVTCPSSTLCSVCKRSFAKSSAPFKSLSKVARKLYNKQTTKKGARNLKRNRIPIAGGKYILQTHVKNFMDKKSKPWGQVR